MLARKRDCGTLARLAARRGAWRFGFYGLVIASTVRTSDAAAQVLAPSKPETDSVSVASFNVRNLGPGEHRRMTALAFALAGPLGAPDIVGLQELTDDDNAIDSGRPEGDKVWGLVLSALKREGLENYHHAQADPTDGQDGGRPGCNIRSGFLLGPQVHLLSMTRLGADDPSFARTRKPLHIEVNAKGRRLCVVNVHLSSRRGGNTTAGKRARQVAFILRAVQERQQGRPACLPIVLGDFNDEPQDASMAPLFAAGFQGSHAHLRPPEAFSYVYAREGRLYDHILAPQGALSAAHVLHHSEAYPAGWLSDHAPVWSRIRLPARASTGAQPACAVAGPEAEASRGFGGFSFLFLLAASVGLTRLRGCVPQKGRRLRGSGRLHRVRRDKPRIGTPHSRDI